MACKWLLPVIVALSVLSTSCGKFPRDPEQTLEKVQNKKLKAGITENPPYVRFTKAGPAGTEVEMVRAFAHDLDARVEWVKGSEEVLMELLKEGQINVCAGGLSSESAWKKHIYLTVPHDTIVYKWGVPPGSGLPDNLKEKRVYVEKNSPAAAFVTRMGGQPVYRDSLTGNEPLIAGPERELAELGYKISEKDIKEEKIVFAVQKGENAFVARLEKFMKQYGKESRR